MTDEKLIEAFNALRLLWEELPPVRINPTRKPIQYDDRQDARSHLNWMCEEAQGFIRDGRRDKAMRWLGFIQGALWGMCDVTIEQMKELNRP